jgi:hypothetical protein
LGKERRECGGEAIKVQRDTYFQKGEGSECFDTVGKKQSLGRGDESRERGFQLNSRF